jgi:membrane-bound lytic murein transglycosylase MltF
MKNKVICNIATIAVCFCLVFGISASALAGSSVSVSDSGNHVQKALTNSLQKNQFLFISKKLNQLKLPKELAFIPIIESHYNNHAVSPKGAGGLWQLMPSTAKQFGVSNKGRFQLEPSTVAALSYFSQLHKKFGNWEFAIAAYNAGDGRVQKALKQNPSATRVRQLNLPRETKQYVQKFYSMQGDLRARSL